MKTLKTQVVKMVQITYLRHNGNEDNTFDGGAPYYKKDAVITQRCLNSLIF